MIILEECVAESGRREMIDSEGGGCIVVRVGLVYNSPEHRGAVDHLPFQGFGSLDLWRSQRTLFVH